MEKLKHMFVQRDQIMEYIFLGSSSFKLFHTTILHIIIHWTDDTDWSKIVK